MTEGYQEPLEAQRSRALDVSRSEGALIQADYLNRRQEYVAVNRNDLEDLKTFDVLSAFLYGCGMFFLSGSVWAGVVKYFERGAFSNDIVFFLLFAICGVIFLVVGHVVSSKKRSRIDRIFGEAQPRTQ